MMQIAIFFVLLLIAFPRFAIFLLQAGFVLLGVGIVILLAAGSGG